MPNKPLSAEIVALIHHVQLSDAGWWNKSVDQLIRASMWANQDASTPHNVRQCVMDAAGVRLTHEDVLASLRRLKHAGDVFEVEPNRLKLSEQACEQIEFRIDDITQTENKACELFKEYLTSTGIESNSDIVWKRFREEVVSPIIGELGARTYELLQHGDQVFTELDTVKEFTYSFPKTQRDNITAVMRNFISSQNRAVKKFLLAHMTSAFCAEAGRILSCHAFQLESLGRYS